MVNMRGRTASHRDDLWPRCTLKKGVRGQMKIQQMAFMIIALLFFFILVGLFLLRISASGIEDSANLLEKEIAISSIEVIANMPEFNCDSKVSMCLDLDKVRILSGNKSDDYYEFLPVSSIKVYKISPKPSGEPVECPATNCHYYDVFHDESGQGKEYSGFVSLCERTREGGTVYDKCEVGKLVVGARSRG